MFQRADAGNGLDAADSGGYGFFTDDFQHADISGALDVRAATKLFRIEATRGARIGDRYHANVVLRILVAEKCQRAGSQRLFERSHVRLDLRVQADLVV